MSSIAVLARTPEQEGVALLDQYSPAHLAVGMLAGLLGMDPHKAVMLFIGAKIVETGLREGLGHSIFGRESGQSLGNEFTDVAVETLGLALGHRLRALATEEPVAPTAGLGSEESRVQAAFNWVQSRFGGHPGIIDVSVQNNAIVVRVNGFTPGVIPGDVMGVPVQQVVVSQGEGVGAYYSNRFVQSIR
jgi:hypothetical protein